MCDNKETTRIMKSFQTALALLLGVFFVFNTFVSNASDGDSTSSSIAFNGLEATLSSRIIHFKWDVSSEENGAFILVEKSLNEEDWTEVAKVASLKSHKEQHTYEISEINFAEGVNEYFRIVRVDEFGKKTELDPVQKTALRYIPMYHRNDMVRNYARLYEIEGKDNRAKLATIYAVKVQ